MDHCKAMVLISTGRCGRLPEPANRRRSFWVWSATMNWQIFSLALHLGALALWLGSVVFFLVVFGPATKELESGVALRVLDQGRRALEAVAWAGIGLLLISGIMNLI